MSKTLCFLLKAINLNFNLNVHIWPHSTYNDLENGHFFKALEFPRAVFSLSLSSEILQHRKNLVPFKFQSELI